MGALLSTVDCIKCNIRNSEKPIDGLRFFPEAGCPINYAARDNFPKIEKINFIWTIIFLNFKVL